MRPTYKRWGMGGECYLDVNEECIEIATKADGGYVYVYCHELDSLLDALMHIRQHIKEQSPYSLLGSSEEDL